MCELLGMSANVPTDICFSFKGLKERGGNTGPHKDGWGIAFYQGKGVSTFKDAQSSHQSEVAKLVTHYPIKSNVVVGHVRQANRGRVALENTHPFSRELWGRYWTYAHNGQLTDYKSLPLGRFRPVGTTDSEHAFCYMLSQLADKFPLQAPPRRQLFRLLKKLSDLIYCYRMDGICFVIALPNCIGSPEGRLLVKQNCRMWMSISTSARRPPPMMWSPLSRRCH